jgi:hypothetical protein
MGRIGFISVTSTSFAHRHFAAEVNGQYRARILSFLCCGHKRIAMRNGFHIGTTSSVQRARPAQDHHRGCYTTAGSEKKKAAPVGG